MNNCFILNCVSSVHNFLGASLHQWLRTFQDLLITDMITAYVHTIIKHHKREPSNIDF
jgi:hypothetical protein